MAKKVKKKARRRKRRLSIKQKYTRDMNAWLAQKNQEIAGCQREVRRLLRDIKLYQDYIHAARAAIKLLQKQIANARRSRDEGRQDLRENLATMT